MQKMLGSFLVRSEGQSQPSSPFEFGLAVAWCSLCQGLAPRHGIINIPHRYVDPCRRPHLDFGLSLGFRALRRNLAKWPIGGDLNDLEPGRWSLMLASLASGTNLRKRTAGNGPGTGENVRCACRDAIE